MLNVKKKENVWFLIRLILGPYNVMCVRNSQVRKYGTYVDSKILHSNRGVGIVQSV